MQYLCCGNVLLLELQREYCWPDTYRLWPSASRYRAADPDFEDALKATLFSQLSVYCCRGGLFKRISKEIDERLLQGLQIHVRTAVRFKTYLWGISTILRFLKPLISIQKTCYSCLITRLWGEQCRGNAGYVTRSSKLLVPGSARKPYYFGEVEILHLSSRTVRHG